MRQTATRPPKEASCREPFRLAALAEDRSGRSCLWWRIDPRWGRKWNRRTLVRTVIGGTAANPSGRIADLRRSRRSASDSLRQYRADWLFGAVRWIDAGADYIIEHPPPKCLGHDADEGRAVSCASYVRSNPGELVEVVPYDPRTVVQSQVLRHPGRDRYREARVIVTRRYRRGDDA